MATPELDPAGLLALTAELGLDGIELVVQHGYRCALPPDAPLTAVRALRDQATALGLSVGGLVPYAKGQNHPDPAVRRAATTELAHVVGLAAAAGAPIVRVFAGEAVAEDDWSRARDDLAAGLSELSGIAADLGVTLAVENHMDTMATTAARTMEIVRAVDHPATGILFDPANLAFMRAEAAVDALAIQAAAIRHVHVKDMAWVGGRRRAALPGAGVVPWPDLVGTLQTRGYAGAWSLEYEARWFPGELPPVRSGAATAAAYLRSLLRTCRLPATAAPLRVPVR